jgi:hypothetical protein
MCAGLTVLTKTDLRSEPFGRLVRHDRRRYGPLDIGWAESDGL